MAFFATKKFSYWGQLGVLAAFTGAGLAIALLINWIPFMSVIKPGMTEKQLTAVIATPENVPLLRWLQFLGTLFIFFVPAVGYAKLCHSEAFRHLGFKNKVTVPQFIVAVVIILTAQPLVSTLSDLFMMLPWSDASVAKFKAAEEAYMDQVKIIGRMNNLGEYFISLFMLALLPAVFEETLFRGALQNLLTRWWKSPIIAIIITSLIFSYVHGSYIGLLSRAALGFILGWMYNRTGNIWLSMIAHMANNAGAVTLMYLSKSTTPDQHLPLWAGLVSLIIVICFLWLFDKISQYQINRPGKEVLMEVNDFSQPSWVK